MYKNLQTISARVLATIIGFFLSSEYKSFSSSKNKDASKHTSSNYRNNLFLHIWISAAANHYPLKFTTYQQSTVYIPVQNSNARFDYRYVCQPISSQSHSTHTPVAHPQNPYTHHSLYNTCTLCLTQR